MASECDRSLPELDGDEANNLQGVAEGEIEFTICSEFDSESDSEGELESACSPVDSHRLRDFSDRFTKALNAPDLDMSLCPRCRVVDLVAALDSADAGEDLNGAVVAHLPPLTEAATDPTCRLCSFLLGLTYDISPDWKSTKHPWKLCAFDSSEVRGIPRTWAKLTEVHSIAFTLVPNGLIWLGIEKTSAFFVPVGCSGARMQKHGRLLYRARQLSASFINYGLIKEWLRDCTGKHKSCRLERPTMKPHKVIDCLQRNIISSTSSTEYFALSYVWGRRVDGDESSSPISGNSKLPDHIPAVVSDAMRLVISLGYQYLWVDRYCIDQADADKKHQQISLMDDIYEGALATVIATSSKAASEGLPGISMPRITTPCVPISEKVCLQIIRTVEDSLATSEWNSRGWTYQEFCLSRRCLILADDQVYFICRWGMTSEGLQEADLSDQPFVAHRCLDSRMLHGFVRAIDRQPKFVRELDAYTQRVLSYDSDTLNAFRGILSRSQLASYWGVPIYNIRTTGISFIGAAWGDLLFHVGFSVGLCWTACNANSDVEQAANASVTKIQRLPSWSWVSSRCRIQYHDTLYDLELTEDELTAILSANLGEVHRYAQVFLDDPSKNNHETLCAMSRSSGAHSCVIRERSPFIYIRSVVKAIPVERWSQLRHWIAWDSGNAPEDMEAPLKLILLISMDRYRNVPVHWYMVVTLEGDTARRVGLLDIVHSAIENSLVTIHKMKTIKIG